MYKNSVFTGNQIIPDCIDTWSQQKRYVKREDGLTKYKSGTYVPVRDRTRSRRELPMLATYKHWAKIAHPVAHPECISQEVSTTTELVLLNDSGALVDDSELPDPFLLQVGGLRSDPFRMFPIESKHHIAEAFDYCKTRLR